MVDQDRRRILAEFRSLIQEAANTAAKTATDKILTENPAAVSVNAEALEESDGKRDPVESKTDSVTRGRDRSSRNGVR